MPESSPLPSSGRAPPTPVPDSTRPHDRGGANGRRRAAADRLLRIVGLSFICDSVLLLGFALNGSTSSWAPALLATGGLIHIAVFATINRSRWFDRLDDFQLTACHMVSGLSAHLLMAALFPEVGALILLPLFLVFGFSALLLSAFQVWYFLGAAMMALTFMLFGLELELRWPASDAVERVLTLLFFSSCLGRSLLLGVIAHRLQDRLSARNRQLKITMAEVHRLATTDELTGGLNRRSTMAALQNESDRCALGSSVACVAMMDLDHFKQINDRFGHAVGDQVLRDFVFIAGQTIAASDMIGRIGGEEFLIVMPDVSLLQARELAQRLREALSAHDWRIGDSGESVTASIGIAERQHGETAAEWLERADKAMYDAKAEGRNRIRLAAPRTAAFLLDPPHADADRMAASDAGAIAHTSPWLAV